MSITGRVYFFSSIHGFSNASSEASSKEIQEICCWTRACDFTPLIHRLRVWIDHYPLYIIEHSDDEDEVGGRRRE